MKTSLRLLAPAILLIAFNPFLEAQIAPSTRVPPVYPLAARAAWIEGAVVLKCTISKEGKVENLKVVSGPPALQQAAKDAVLQWTYKPYKHFGRIVEVDTTITVNFNLGKDAKERAAAQAKAQAELAQSNPQSPDSQNAQPGAPKE